MPLVWTNLEPCTYEGQPLLAEEFIALYNQMYLYAEFLISVCVRMYMCVNVHACIFLSALRFCAHASLRAKPYGTPSTRKLCKLLFKALSL